MCEEHFYTFLAEVREVMRQPNFSDPMERANLAMERFNSFCDENFDINDPWVANTIVKYMIVDYKKVTIGFLRRICASALEAFFIKGDLGFIRRWFEYTLPQWYDPAKEIQLGDREYLYRGKRIYLSQRGLAYEVVPKHWGAPKRIPGCYFSNQLGKWVNLQDIPESENLRDYAVGDLVQADIDKPFWTWFNSKYRKQVM
jgi:hypothetical protein